MEFAITSSMVSTLDDRLVRIHCPNLLSQSRRERRRFALRSHHDSRHERRKNVLLIWNIHLTLGRQFVTHLRGVLNDADDRWTGPSSIRPREPFAQRAPIREELAGQILVDDRYFGSTGLIAVGKVAAGDQRNAHRGKVFRADGPRRCRLGFAVGPGEDKIKGTVDTGKRQVVYDGRRLDSRNCFHALQNLAIVCHLPRPWCRTCRLVAAA